MTIAYLMDTDWALHHLNGHQRLLQRLRGLVAEGLGLCMLSLAEMHEGVYYSRDPEESARALNAFFESVSLLGIDEKTAKIFGRERGRLRAAGLLPVMEISALDIIANKNWVFLSADTRR